MSLTDNNKVENKTLLLKNYFQTVLLYQTFATVLSSFSFILYLKAIIVKRLTNIDPRVACVPIIPTTLITTNFANCIIYNDVATLHC